MVVHLQYNSNNTNIHIGISIYAHTHEKTVNGIRSLKNLKILTTEAY